ncbi:hypothetical protein ACTXT7_010563 [Hymenolepis weldensis]
MDTERVDDLPVPKEEVLKRETGDAKAVCGLENKTNSRNSKLKKKEKLRRKEKTVAHGLMVRKRQKEEVFLGGVLDGLIVGGIANAITSGLRSAAEIIAVTGGTQMPTNVPFSQCTNIVEDIAELIKKLVDSDEGISKLTNKEKRRRSHYSDTIPDSRDNIAFEQSTIKQDSMEEGEPPAKTNNYETLYQAKEHKLEIMQLKLPVPYTYGHNKRA